MNGMEGQAFLKYDFTSNKPNFASGETCYYNAVGSSNHYMARVAISTSGVASGTIIISSTSVQAMTTTSTGKLYGTIEWYID